MGVVGVVEKEEMEEGVEKGMGGAMGVGGMMEEVEREGVETVEGMEMEVGVAMGV
jgi:hypothetical protein